MPVETVFMEAGSVKMLFKERCARCSAWSFEKGCRAKECPY